MILESQGNGYSTEWGSKRALLWVGVAIVGMVVMGFALFAYVSPGIAYRSAGLSQSAASSVPLFSQSVLQAHLDKFDDLNFNGAAGDYSDNAAVIWQGAAGTSLAYGGIYYGQNDIRSLLVNAFGRSTSMWVTIISFDDKPWFNPGMEQVNATLFLQGNGTTIGQVTANISANYKFVYSNGVWQISQENWIYDAITTN